MISLIPISDSNPTRTFPTVTVILIVLNVVAFFFVQPDFGAGPDATRYFVDNVAVPCQLENDCDETISQFSGVPDALSDPPERPLLSFVWAIVFSTFLHGGFLHLGGNMLFLWVFGNNIEDFLGHWKYAIFYLLAGIAAGFAQVLTNLEGANSIIPAIGASGAIAGVMGAYLVLHPRARINCLVPLFVFWTVIQLSAWVVLGIWFVFQFFTGDQSGIAWMAHVGGFVFGVIAILLLGGRPQRPQRLYYEPLPRY